jgi:hypothetical protein
VKVQSKLKTLELLGGISGWIWLASVPCTLWFFFAAAFGDSPWSRFFWALGIGFVGKSLLRGFEAHKNRVALEATLITQGVAADQAREVGFVAMNGSREALMRKLQEIDVPESVFVPRSE